MSCYCYCLFVIHVVCCAVARFKFELFIEALLLFSLFSELGFS